MSLMGKNMLTRGEVKATLDSTEILCLPFEIGLLIKK